MKWSNELQTWLSLHLWNKYYPGCTMNRQIMIGGWTWKITYNKKKIFFKGFNTPLNPIKTVIPIARLIFLSSDDIP